MFARCVSPCYTYAMRILIVPDSFKGSLTATEFCDVAERGIRKVIPDADILKMPIADGGEGTMDSILSVLGGYTEKIEVTGAFVDEKRTVRVGFVDGDETSVKTAVIETAEAMGLPSVGEKKNPCLTTTFGVGEMIEYALERGAKKLILTLGGSSTNDCGAGMMAALGAVFGDSDGGAFVPTGGTLGKVLSCDFSAMFEKLSGIEIVAMCDVTNPLCGENGCSAVYAPQKGADAAMVKFLDSGCRHFADVVASSTGKDFSEFPGAGAAGGLGFACVSCLHGTLRSGIDTILSLYNFGAAAGTADYVVTGEGRFDEQSLMGKAIGGIVKKTREAAVAARRGNIPVVVFCGKSEAAFPELLVYEISAGQELEYAMSHAAQNLELSVEKWAVGVREGV